MLRRPVSLDVGLIEGLGFRVAGLLIVFFARHVFKRNRRLPTRPVSLDMGSSCYFVLGF